MPDGVRRKWRPGLWAVVVLVLALVLCLPFAGLLLFGFYANQLVQQTEESVLTQASVLSATYAQMYLEEVGAPPPDTPAERTDDEDADVGGPDFAPVFPSLSPSPETILAPRPDARGVTQAPDPIYMRLGPRLTRIATDSQAQTLAGYRIPPRQRHRRQCRGRTVARPRGGDRPRASR